MTAKRLIITILCISAFTACKKPKNDTNAISATSYTGIKNVSDFDKAILELGKKTGSRANKNSVKINLSKEAIKEMRNSISFDKQERFRGFLRSGLLHKELSVDQAIYFIGKLIDSPTILMDQNSKMIGNSVPVNWQKPLVPGVHYDWRWKLQECCERYYDATCVTYGTGIVCN